MAALEGLRLLHQVIQNLEGLRRDMRANAKSYKANLAAGRTPAQVAVIMEQDALQYQKRIAWFDRFLVAGTPRTVLLDGFQRNGIQASDAQDILTELSTPVQQQLTLARNTPTANQINNSMDQLLAAIPAHESLWPESGAVIET